ncbi:hypothetical protein Rhe02_43030 [Rhizocola hellebori]|uniref:DUF3558 domain-containing protein n=1 Tax=Rhizocola hellebori TaxID=1392758 RepID=A0A8J3VHP5_9ACTN|nr:hypothetical protein [Rhizocola hellebori]GIH06236.1 hypothetical protein Rhe02_43030 [Rhizocola hellebori]
MRLPILIPLVLLTSACAASPSDPPPAAPVAKPAYHAPAEGFCKKLDLEAFAGKYGPLLPIGIFEDQSSGQIPSHTCQANFSQERSISSGGSVNLLIIVFPTEEAAIGGYTRTAGLPSAAQAEAGVSADEVKWTSSADTWQLVMRDDNAVVTVKVTSKDSPFDVSLAVPLKELGNQVLERMRAA